MEQRVGAGGAVGGLRTTLERRQKGLDRSIREPPQALGLGRGSLEAVVR